MLTVGAVKAQLRTLFETFGVKGLPQNEKRGRLAELAVEEGLVSSGLDPPSPVS